MNRKIFLCGIILCTAVLSGGCGHNAVSYFNGADMSFEPDLEHGISAHIRYGQVVHIVMKEKSRAQITLQRGSSVNGSTAENDRTEITFETGDQTNGYVVELEKAGRSAH